MRVASRVRVFVCVSGLRLSWRLACVTFFPIVEKGTGASRNNNGVFGELFPALRLHEDDPEACVQQTPAVPRLPHICGVGLINRLDNQETGRRVSG